MCAHPALCRNQWMTQYFPTSTNETDRGYLHSEIAANSVQGSSTVTGSHEGEGGAWRLICSFDSRRPHIPRQDSLTRGSGRPIAPTHRMNVRPWFGSASWLAPSISGGDKQPVELLADEDWTTPAATPRADGRSFWADSVAKVDFRR